MKIEHSAPFWIALSVVACSTETAQGVFPANDAAASDAPPGEVATTGEFAALTYNVAGLPEGISGSHPATNTPYISPLLNAYELVLVQEDWLTPDPNPGFTVFHDLLAAEAHHPFQSTPAPCPVGSNPARPSALVSDGINEFSVFDFHDLKRVPWDGCFGALGASEGASDCAAMKGFFVAVHVLSPGAPVDVYDLHGEAGSTASDQRLQEDDFRQLAAFINEHSAGHAVILGGDTNLHTAPTNPDAAIWQGFLAATGLADVCQSVDCGADSNVIDKFAFRSSDALTVQPLSHRFERDKFVGPDGQALSDHDALAVRFRWTKIR